MSSRRPETSPKRKLSNIIEADEISNATAEDIDTDTTSPKKKVKLYCNVRYGVYEHDLGKEFQHETQLVQEGSSPAQLETRGMREESPRENLHPAQEATHTTQQNVQPSPEQSVQERAQPVQGDMRAALVGTQIAQESVHALQESTLPAQRNTLPSHENDPSIQHGILPAQEGTPSVQRDMKPIREDNRELQRSMHSRQEDNSFTRQGAQLVNIELDWYTAYQQMCRRIINITKSNAQWGDVRQVVSGSMYELRDDQNNVRLRYEIRLLHRDGENDAGEPLWTRQQIEVSPLTPWYLNSKFEMHVEMYNGSKSNKGTHFIEGFNDGGEANHGMEQAVAAYFKKNDDVKIFRRSVELIDNNGQVRQRYITIPINCPLEIWSNPSLPLSEVAPPAPTHAVADGDTREGNAPSPFVPEHEDSQPQAEISQHPSPPPQLQPPSATSNPPLQPTQNPQPTPQQQQEDDHDNDPNTLWCHCQTPYDGRLMVGCDGDNCRYEWFHLNCVRLRKVPVTRKWYCTDCRPTRKGKKKQTKGAAKKTAKGKVTTATGQVAKKAPRKDAAAGRKKKEVVVPSTDRKTRGDGRK